MPSQGAVQHDPTKTKAKDAHEQHLAPFTVKELRDAIPDHCFERSLLKSSSYLAADIVAISVLISIGYYFNNYISEHTSWVAAILFWNVLWFLQGNFMTGVWVIGHECGHQSFSKSKSINNAVGWVVHSALMVPYHSWRITHGIHHKHTSHMDRDQVYVPKTYTQVHGNGGEDVHNVIAESPLGNLIQIFTTVTIGWPIYLATNAWGQDYKGKKASHFVPSSPMFKPEQKLDIIISNIGMVIALSLLGLFAYNYSFDSAIKYYIIPYFWSNFWLVSITYLQHTDKRVPHYRGEEWNFIRGALCTVDRDYGLLNTVHHNIGDTHVAHHLFSLMPHYHAQEATECLKKVLGDYYMHDDTPVLKALWKSWNTCHYVEDKGSVVYYKTHDVKKQK